MALQDSIVIAGAARTPLGAFQGVFKDTSASELGAAAMRGAIESGKVSVETIDEVIMGCVLSAGQGQAPARQAALKAGLPDHVPATTVNKMCGSGMKAIMLAHDAIRAGSADLVVAGGMESMTGAPYLLPRARSGYRMGHDRIVDHMFLDGLEDAYEKGRLMGTFAEDCAEAYGFTRDEQDRFALISFERATQAIGKGSFETEIAPVSMTTRKAVETIGRDEPPDRMDANKIPVLRPAFREGGTVTAANSSSIADGAAAVTLTAAARAERLGLSTLARIVGHASVAQAPSLFTTAPSASIRILCEKVGWDIRSVDLFEINEAFAVVPMAAMKDLGLPHDKVNVHGGACALGHPIGASGARIVVTLVSALRRYGLRRGIASVCIGGGEATAIAVEIDW